MSNAAREHRLLQAAAGSYSYTDGRFDWQKWSDNYDRGLANLQAAMDRWQAAEEALDHAGAELAKAIRTVTVK